MKHNDDTHGLEQPLIRAAEAAEKLLPCLTGEGRNAAETAVGILRRKVLPILHGECPLLVAVTGGGSSGKSTLFNWLAGGEYSGVKSKAGYTRRTLAAVHPSVAGSAERMELLFDVFKRNARPVQLQSPREMLEPGNPLYVVSDGISPKLAVLDTPDFDTGCRDGFANRGAAEEILAASDVLLYIFTNQSYNNKANSDFVRNAVSGVGRRKVVLLYRCSAAYPAEEIEEHMTTVLRNLFPDSPDPRSEALGLYRIDESDAVVAGRSPPNVRQLDGSPELKDLLGAFDVSKMRTDSLFSMVRGAAAALRRVADSVAVLRDEWAAYGDAVRLRTSIAANESLKRFPQRELMKDFVRCWEDAQPWIVRNAHRWSRAVFGGVKSLGRILRLGAGKTAGREELQPYAEVFRQDFWDQIQKLRADVCSAVPIAVEFSGMSDEVVSLRKAVERLQKIEPGRYGCSSGGTLENVWGKVSVSRPSSLADSLATASAALSGKDVSPTVEKAVAIVSDNSAVVARIRELVRETRSSMGVLQRSKEIFWAAAETLPAIGTAAWVVCTADAAAPTVLASVFGYADLGAPVIYWGIEKVNDKVQRHALKSEFDSIFRRWHAENIRPIRELLAADVETALVKPCDDALRETKGPCERLAAALESLGTAMENMS